MRNCILGRLVECLVFSPGVSDFITNHSRFKELSNKPRSINSFSFYQLVYFIRELKVDKILIFSDTPPRSADRVEIKSTLAWVSIEKWCSLNCFDLHETDLPFSTKFHASNRWILGNIFCKFLIFWSYFGLIKHFNWTL